MANEGTIVTAGKEQISRLIELVEKGQSDNTAKLTGIDERLKAVEARPETPEGAVTADQLREVKESLEGHQTTLAMVEERLRNLDQVLPIGQKVYQPIVTDNTARTQELRSEMARTILDIGCLSRNARPKFASEFFKREQTDAVDADGGYIVPPEFRNEIIRIVQTYGVARQLCRVVPMRGKELNVPTNSDLPAVYWDTQLVGAKELVAPNESKATVARETVTAHKLIALDTISIELEEDSIPTISNFLLDLFGIAVAKAEDEQCLTSDGSGTNPFTGLLYLSGITDVVGSVNTYAGSLEATGVDGGYNKLIETQDAVDEAVADSSVWVLSNSVLNGVRRIKNTQESPLWTEMVGGVPGTIFGSRYVRSRIMPKIKDAGSQADKPFIIFGDFSYHVMGDRMALTFDMSPHAAFKEAGLVMRLMERVAFKTMLKTPFARLNSAS